MNFIKGKAILLPALLGLLLSSCKRPETYISISGFAQGGTYKVTIGLTGVKAKPEELKHGIDSILNLIDTSLSGYNKKSLLSRLNRGDTIVPNKTFADLYAAGMNFFQETDSAVDVAAAPLFDMWGFGFTSDSLPSDGLVKETLGRCGMKLLLPSVYDAIGEDGRLCGKDLLKAEYKGKDLSPELNFNAIAQGYSSDAIASYLYRAGVKNMLVDIGEIFCDGVNPSGLPWSIGVDKPVDGNETPGQMLQGIWTSGGKACGIVTSGNYRKYYVVDGKKYSHTIDPRSGYPVRDSLLSATIVSADAMSADAYATYCMVLGYEKAKSFISGASGLEGYLIYSSEGEMRTWKSEGFALKE